MGGTPCDGCIAGCCREYHLLPSGHDVYRIASALELPLAEVVSLRARQGCEGEFRIRLAANATTHHRLELKKVADSGEWERRCVFLMTVGGRGRCGIYSVRPVECALYPFASEGNQIVALGRRPYCPPDEWPMNESARGLLEQKREERRIFDRFVDEWNASVESASEADFFNALMASYSKVA